MENDEPIYREELRSMLFLLADIRMAVEETLRYIKGEDEEEEEEPDT